MPATYAVKYRKANDRYYVDLDGTEVGWVTYSTYDREWSFYACTRTALTGERLAVDKQRGSAVEEGLSSLRIWHLGAVVALDKDRTSDTYMKDVWVYFDTDRLAATVTQLMDRRYGLTPTTANPEEGA